jgi:hypothetical protein
MAILRLGITDRGAVPQSVAAFFGLYHESSGMLNKFRGEKNNRWRGFSEQPGKAVFDLQTRLRSFGFLPHGDLNGIFDYRTQSSARLFQEYVRSVEKDASIGVADAIVGPKTFQHLGRWMSGGLTADWINASSSNPTGAYKDWMSLLEKLKAHYQQAPSLMLQKVEAFSEASDTRSVVDWKFAPEHVHLIGIRRGADTSWKIRINNDVFVLLVNGLVFMFFGSTEPTPQGERRQRPPFLVPGQHLYRFGWHKVSSQEKVYRAFRPAKYGVLIIRDMPGSAPDALDAADLERGAVQNNLTINIHWSGKHTSNWSAGCQVISGGGYINHHNDLIDCWQYAAATYTQLSNLTRAAYNVLLDLITIFSKNTSVSKGDLLHYTLINESDLDLEPSIGASKARDILNQGLQILAANDRQKYNQYKDLLA